MKKLIPLVFLLLGCATETKTETPAVAEQTPAAPVSFVAPGDHTPDEIYEKLMAIAAEGARQKPRPPQGTEFTVMLPSELPEGDRKKEWIGSTVQVIYRDQKSVNQITMETGNCNVESDKLDEAALKNRVQAQVALVSKTLFGMPFHLSDGAFKDLGSDWDQPIRVPIKQEYLPVMDMRLIRARTKCDGHGGYGYRYDFFMK